MPGAEDFAALMRTRVLANRKAAPKKFTEEEQQLRDLWNTQNVDTPKNEKEANDALSGEYPQLPTKPGIFKGDPYVSNPELGRLFYEYSKLAPNLRDRVNRIQQGPGAALIGDFDQNRVANFPGEWAEKPLNVLGVTRRKTGEININPYIGSPEHLKRKGTEREYGDFPPDEVLAHELTHAVGYGGDKPTDPTERARMIQKARKKK